MYAFMKYGRDYTTTRTSLLHRTSDLIWVKADGNLADFLNEYTKQNEIVYSNTDTNPDFYAYRPDETILVPVKYKTEDEEDIEFKKGREYNFCPCTGLQASFKGNLIPILERDIFKKLLNRHYRCAHFYDLNTISFQPIAVAEGVQEVRLRDLLRGPGYSNTVVDYQSGTAGTTKYTAFSVNGAFVFPNGLVAVIKTTK